MRQAVSHCIQVGKPAHLDTSLASLEGHPSDIVDLRAVHCTILNSVGNGNGSGVCIGAHPMHHTSTATGGCFTQLSQIRAQGHVFAGVHLQLSKMADNFIDAIGNGARSDAEALSAEICAWIDNRTAPKALPAGVPVGQLNA